MARDVQFGESEILDNFIRHVSDLLALACNIPEDQRAAIAEKLYIAIGVPPGLNLKTRARIVEIVKERLETWTDRVYLVAEPVACALTLTQTGEVDEDTYMLFDLGGGTFDVSLMNLENNVFRVLYSRTLVRSSAFIRRAHPPPCIYNACQLRPCTCSSRAATRTRSCCGRTTSSSVWGHATKTTVCPSKRPTRSR